LLIIGLAALRCWRTLGFAVLAAVLLGLLDLPGVLQFQTNLHGLIADHAPSHHGQFLAFHHALGGWWRVLCLQLHWRTLARLPEPLVTLGLLAPLLGWVSYRLFRCPDRMSLVFPYLTWLAAAASFLPPVAYDYSLVFLPLAALAVWDRRDPVFVHLLMAFLLLWWQPLQLSIGALLLFAFKLAGLAAVGASLGQRAAERSHAHFQKPPARQPVALPSAA
jgi:hypothetical protein